MRIALLFLLASIAVLHAGEAWSPAEYRQQLTTLAAAIDAGEDVRVQALAKRIASAEVAWPGGTLVGDPTLAPLAQRHAFAALRQRVQSLNTELTELDQSAPAATVDAAQLQRLAAREAEAGQALRRGGEVAGNPYDPSHLPPTVWERISLTFEWIGERLGEFFDWLRRLFQHEKSGKSSGDGSGVVILTLIIVGALVLVGVVLAILAWPKRNTALALPAIPAAAPAIDADPRTRAADEWVRYARELFALGRYREGIRAWYHAMLVNCWSHGQLHHRVGRTNWEYALTIPATQPWRGRFQDLTRRFDRAWYGGRIEIDEAHAFAIEAEQVMSQSRTSASAGGV